MPCIDRQSKSIPVDSKKLRNLGSDLGGALKGFKKAMNPEDEDKDDSTNAQLSEESSGDTIDVTAEKVNDKHN